MSIACYYPPVMTVEAGTRSPETTAAQTAYKKAFYDRFDLMGLAPEYASLEISQMEKRGFVPTVEFMMRADSLPPSLQTLVDKTFQGFSSNLRVVMGLHRVALIATNSDGTPDTSHVSFGENGRLIQIGYEIAFNVDRADYGITKAILQKTNTYSIPQLIAQQTEWQELKPEIITGLAELIGRDSTGEISTVTIYHHQHPDLPPSFRNDSPSL